MIVASSAHSSHALLTHCAYRLTSPRLRTARTDVTDLGYVAAESRRSPGGESMPIDPDLAIGAALPDQRFSWTSSDVLLYHLAIGAGHREDDPVDPVTLRLTYDDDRLQVLPSFGIVAPGFHRTTPPTLDLPGCDIDLTQVLHGSQSVAVHGPIPTSGSATLRTRISDVWDKGKAAVIVQS